MRRPTAFSSITQSFKAALAAALAFAAVVSCDSYGTSVEPPPDGTVRVLVHTVGNNYTAAQKDSVLAAEAAAAGGSFSRIVPLGPITNVVGSPGSSAAMLAACGGDVGGFLGYTRSPSPADSVPEAIPNLAPYPIKDDGVIADIPLGFNFSFEGQTYDKVNVYMNGFLSFGAATGSGTFYSDAGSIPSPLAPNNIIALAWTDWQPNLVADGLRYETRGEAPHRRFIFQFNNVPEYISTNRSGAISPLAGRLLGQIILHEGSNDIDIYTNEMSTFSGGTHRVTQGIEDAAGAFANYDSVFNPVLNMMQARVKIMFTLHNDGIRFSLVSSKDQEKPSINPAPDDTVATDPGLSTALVALAAPSTNDNCSEVTVTSSRSDGKAMDAAYPLGTTTVTWTATDAAGNFATAQQTVTVVDKEAPVWDADFGSVFERNATSPDGAVVDFGNLPVRDNVGVTSISCDPASGSTFPIGSTPATCTASDAAGNTAAKSLVVVVVNAHEQIENLIEWVRALHLPDGTAEPVINQLLAAYDETADGSPSCKKMYDFMTMAQKKNSNITGPDVEYMLAQASRILTVMGCAPARNPVPVTPSHRGNQ